MKFKVGDKVLINKDSEYFGQGNQEVGKITNVENKNILISYPIRVSWPNGDHNVYRECDLILKLLTAKQLNEQNLC